MTQLLEEIEKLIPGALKEHERIVFAYLTDMEPHKMSYKVSFKMGMRVGAKAYEKLISEEKRNEET